jgi:DNA-binding NarL/FixJ family response regulator
VARCRLRQAEALLTAGDRTRGSAVLTEAHATAVRLGAVALRQSAERLATLARVTLEQPNAPSEGDAGDVPSRPSRAPADHARPFDLTERELQVLPLLAAGYTNRQIGEAMFISPSTAGVHVSRILGKMGVSSRVEAAALAVRSGLA